MDAGDKEIKIGTRFVNAMSRNPTSAVEVKAPEVETEKEKVQEEVKPKGVKGEEKRADEGTSQEQKASKEETKAPKKEILQSFESKFIPLPNTKEWKKFPFGKKSYYPEDLKEFLTNYYNYLYSFDVEDGVELFFYRVIKSAEVIKKKLEDVDDPKKVDALRYDFEGYSVLLKAYKEILDDIQRFYQAKGDITFATLPQEIRDVLDYSSNVNVEYQENEKGELIPVGITSSNSNNEPVLLGVAYLGSTIEIAFNETLKEFKEIVTNREKYIDEVRKIYEHPYYKEWLADRTLMAGGNRLLIFHKLFNEKLKENLQKRSKEIEKFLEQDKETIKRFEEINPEVAEELRKTFLKAHKLLEMSKGGILAIEKRPEEIDKIGNLAYYLNDREKFRIQYLLTELHNLNTLLEKVEKGELTEQDIDELFDNPQLGFVGAGRIFKDEKEAVKAKNFLKKYIEVNANPIEDPLTKEEYKAILKLAKTSTVEEFVKFLKETDAEYQTKKFISKFAEAVGLSRLALNPQTSRLKIFEDCLRKEQSKEGISFLVSSCIEKLINKELIEATRYKQIIEAVKDSFLWTSLFSPATVIMELHSFMKIYSASILRKKQKELLEKTQKEIEDILSLPPEEVNKRVKSFVRKETGIFAEITNPAFTKLKVERFKADVVLTGLMLEHQNLLKEFKKRKERIDFWLKGFAQGKSAEKLIRTYAKWLTDRAKLPKEIAKEEYIILHRENIRKVRKAFAEDMKTLAVVKFILEYQKNLSKGHQEAFEQAYSEIQKLIPLVQVGGNEEREIKEVIEKIPQMVNKYSELADKTHLVVAKDGKALVLGINVLRHNIYLEEFQKVGEDFKEFLKYVFNLNERMIEDNLPRLKNPLTLLTKGLVLKNVQIQVNEEAIKRMKDYQAPQGVNLKQASKFLDSISGKDWEIPEGPGM